MSGQEFGIFLIIFAFSLALSAGMSAINGDYVAPIRALLLRSCIPVLVLFPISNALSESTLIIESVGVYKGSVNSSGKHGTGIITFLDDRKFSGEWAWNFPEKGYLEGRSGKKILLDYKWLGRVTEGGFGEVLIRFENGSRFEGVLDAGFNPIKGHFYDYIGNEISPRSYLDFFEHNSFLRDDSGIQNNNRVGVGGSSEDFFETQNLKDGRVYVGQLSKKYPGAWGRHGKGTMTFTDGRQFVGRWINNYPSEGYLKGRSGERVFVDYGWDRGSFQGGSLYRITISFGDGSRFEGEVDPSYNPYKGTFFDADGSEISPSRYYDFFKPNSFVKGQLEGDNNFVRKLDKDKEVVKVSSGTGFAVNDTGHLVTNSHVVSGCNRIEVFYRGETYDAKILANDLVNDLALLKSPLVSTKHFGVKSDDSLLFDDIYAAGFPFGNSYSTSVKVTSRIVSALAGVGDNYSQIQIDAALQPGNSGGPVFDKSGVLVGVVVSKLSLNDVFRKFGVVPENQNFAIKANLVANLLRSNSVEFHDQNNFERGLQDVENATYHLSCWMERGKVKDYSETKVMFNNLD